jgi:hypothetical protein
VVTNTRTHHDRIDFVYEKGKGLEVSWATGSRPESFGVSNRHLRHILVVAIAYIFSIPKLFIHQVFFKGFLICKRVVTIKEADGSMSKDIGLKFG